MILQGQSQGPIITPHMKMTTINNTSIPVIRDFNYPGPGWDLENKILKPRTNTAKLHYELYNLLDDTGHEQIVAHPTMNDNTAHTRPGDYEHEPAKY